MNDKFIPPQTIRRQSDIQFIEPHWPTMRAGVFQSFYSGNDFSVFENFHSKGFILFYQDWEVPDGLCGLPNGLVPGQSPHPFRLDRSYHPLHAQI